MEGRGCNWTAENTRRILIERSEERFNENIRNADWKRKNKEWHKNLQRYTGYKGNSQILNLNIGPITDGNDLRRYEEGEIEEEEIKIWREKDEI